MEKISAVIITYNEERKIEKCIRSLDFIDEIVVVDSFSTDNTVKIAKKLGASVFQRKFTTFGDQKNFGNKMAKNDFILSIDADEVVSKNLRDSIIDECKRGLDENTVYKIARKTWYLNGFLNHGGYYPEYKIRLFNKNFCSWDNKKLHEGLIFSKKLKTKKLKGDLYHYSYESIDHHLKKIILYSEIDKKSGDFSTFKLLFSPPFRFFKSYILKLGFLDGIRGLIFCSFSSFSIFIRYSKKFEEKINKKL